MFSSLCSGTAHCRIDAPYRRPEPCLYTMPHPSPRSVVLGEVRQVAGAVRVAQFAKQRGEVERLAEEDKLPVAHRPFFTSAVPGQFDAVEIRVVQIDRLMRAVI